MKTTKAITKRISKTKTSKSSVKLSKPKVTFRTIHHIPLITDKNLNISQMSVEPEGTSPEMLQKSILELKKMAKMLAKHGTKGRDKTIVYIQEDNPFRVLIVSKKWNAKEARTLPIYEETF